MDKFLSKIGVKRDESRRPSSTSAPPPPRSTPSSAPSRRSETSQAAQPPESEFAKSARAAASAGLQYEREIDENTDMSTLTDQEISRLMEGMQGDVLKQPLVSGPVPLLAVKKEYLNGSKMVLKKLEWLEEHGWDQVWRARGDGDCFYRSFTLAYLFRILYAPAPGTDAGYALGAIHDTIPSMENAGFQRDLLDEFLSPLLDAVASFIDPLPGNEPTEYGLLQVLQDPEKSNSIVVALRLITGAHIRNNPEDFAPFLFSPNTLEPISPDQFCREEVEPCGKEADHSQIMALAAALQMPVRVAYLDRSDVSGGDVINWVEFGGSAAEESRPLTLLYRPGHFDVVTKDHMQAALREGQTPTPAKPSGQASTSQSQPARQLPKPSVAGSSSSGAVAGVAGKAPAADKQEAEAADKPLVQPTMSDASPKSAFTESVVQPVPSESKAPESGPAEDALAITSDPVEDTLAGRPPQPEDRGEQASPPAVPEHAKRSQTDGKEPDLSADGDADHSEPKASTRSHSEPSPGKDSTENADAASASAPDDAKSADEVVKS